ncbi:MAG: 2-oxoglutarate dehydrogenase E1 component [Burkholderiales bacterium]|jgi:2-oxoglutarate dehydrogenase E1 component|nr:2-oxoglutarate dehydrogenase E1 component [Burkholderiales bacterium]
MRITHHSDPLFGGNAPFVEEKYEQYLSDPESVSQEWRDYFDKLRGNTRDVAHRAVIRAFEKISKTPVKVANAQHSSTAENEQAHKQAAVQLLVSRFRMLGLMQANLDPLKRHGAVNLPELDPATYGFTPADMETVFSTGSLNNSPRAKLKDILHQLRQTYCRTLGAEFMYMTNTARREWLREQLETAYGCREFSSDEKRFILERLTAAETLERYLHTRYIGQKRFSGEGGETLTPMLDHLIQKAGADGVSEIIIGMAHRSRLNILVNTMGKMPTELFGEFEGKVPQDLPSGDVKYHKGFSSNVTTPGGPVHLSLAFNPSHLEIVNPVVEGSVRARQRRKKDLTGDKVLPLLIHGDAAIAGQGVNQEVLNMAQTRGYTTGGTIHIIINNQIGFTTSDPRDTRGTTYCTDIAKMIEAPILHVNADDPEVSLFAMEIALAFRQKFHQDIFIDLVCYRKLGHNEADEPMMTQPLMYKSIHKHPGTRSLYADFLEQSGVIQEGVAEKMVMNYREALDRGEHTNKTILSNYQKPEPSLWPQYKNKHWTEPFDARLDLAHLQKLARKLSELPPNFKLHPRVEKVIADRRLMAEGKLPLDWGMAENLAYAVLLDRGYPIRISGEDVGRGTFSHRHAVLHDQNRERWDSGIWIPLQNIKPHQPEFEIIDSVLTENAVLAFEYGYSISSPEKLVIWEAQFGDFANGAQVVIDQFISSGEVKWGRMSGLTLLLPHGYEGQGPEHSSARPERYLQLCAQENMQFVVPSTPAQIYHLLCRQMVRPYRKPLIVMTPKSLLRHKEAVSDLRLLSDGYFHTVIGDETAKPKQVKRIILCAGKVYYELNEYRIAHHRDDVAIVRLEQQYPFPHDAFKAEMLRYPHAKEILWCQEEPQNQGAWYRLRSCFQRYCAPDQTLAFAGRDLSASPAVGYAVKHAAEQQKVVEDAFSPIETLAKGANASQD